MGVSAGNTIFLEDIRFDLRFLTIALGLIKRAKAVVRNEPDAHAIAESGNAYARVASGPGNDSAQTDCIIYAAHIIANRVV